MWLRWTLRVVVVTLTAVSGYFIWNDFPAKNPPGPPAGSDQFYYEHSVWIGVQSKGDFIDTPFYAPGPTLLLTATDDGWAAVFHVAAGAASSKKGLHGAFLLLVPKGATVGPLDQQGVAVTAEQGKNSETVITVAISGPAGTDFSLDLPVRWSDPVSAQSNGFGKENHFIFLGNAYYAADKVYAIRPYYSSTNRDSSGNTTVDTPVATVTVVLDSAYEHFDDHTEAESSYSTSTKLQYLMNPDNVGKTEGYGLFRTVDVTIVDSVATFIAQLAAQLFFVAIGFLLSELVVMIERKKSAAEAIPATP